MQHTLNRLGVPRNTYKSLPHTGQEFPSGSRICFGANQYLTQAQKFLMAVPHTQAQYFLVARETVMAREAYFGGEGPQNYLQISTSHKPKMSQWLEKGIYFGGGGTGGPQKFLQIITSHKPRMFNIMAAILGAGGQAAPASITKASPKKHKALAIIGNKIVFFFSFQPCQDIL